MLLKNFILVLIFRSLALRLLHYVGASSIEPVLSEAIQLEAARFLFEVGHQSGADHLCNELGDKGIELMSEFEIME